MGQRRSFLAKVANKLRRIRQIAAHAADEAWRSERAGFGADQSVGHVVPLAEDGIVSDPPLVPDHADANRRHRSRRALVRTPRSSGHVALSP